jgi:hypothetical protein
MQADGWLRIATAAGTAALDPALGNIRVLAFEADGRMLEPLHTAWWVGDPSAEIPADTAPVERHLSGDFLCAPFGAGDVEPAPIHGWPANSRWRPLETGRDALHLRLEREVFGATIDKRLRLAPDAPLLYQEHVITGGAGGLSVAHHPMLRLRAGGTLCVSPKRAVLTPDVPVDPGRNRLACPAETTGLDAFPGADGTPVDLTRLPIGDRHEDFVTLVEAPGSRLGWTAVLRDDEDDIVFFLKDPAVLPVTMLWHSNAGRDRAPWGGRHTGVLGVEDGCAAGAAGHRAALGDNPVARTGVATCLALAPGRRHRIAHVTGAVPRPAGWRRIADITLAGGVLTLTEAGGGTLGLSFDPEFLAPA